MATAPSLSRSLLFKVAFAVALSTASLGYLWLSSEYQHSLRAADKLHAQLLESRKQDLRRWVKDLVDYVRYMHTQAEQRATDTVRSQVLQAHNIASHLYDTYRDQHPPGEVEDLVREALRSIRFNNGRGYLFATRLDGVEQLFADRPELEGKNLLDLRDTLGRPVIRDMIAICRDRGEDFYSYTWTKPGAVGKHFRKVSYVKYFAPFDWLFGAGEYVDDMQAEVQAEVLRRIAEVKVDLAGTHSQVFVGHWDEALLHPPPPGDGGGHQTPPGFTARVPQLIASARAGGGFVEYRASSTEENGPGAPKLSYVAGIEQWQWFVGAETDLADIEGAYRESLADTRTAALDNLGKLLLVTVGVMAIGLFLGAWSVRRAQQELETFAKFFADAESAHTPLPLSQLAFKEFRQLATALNGMIAQRAAILEQLATSERRREQTLQSAGVGLWTWDMASNRVEFSPTYGEMLGYAPGELKEAYETWRDLLHPEDREAAVLQVKQALGATDKSWRMQFRMRHKDGSYRWILGQGAVLPTKGDGNPLQASGTHMDITQRIVEEERYRTLVRTSPWGILTLRLEPAGDLIFTGTNPAADTILNTSCQGFLGQRLEEAIPVLATGDLPATYRNVAREGGVWAAAQFAYSDDNITGTFDIRAFQTAPGELAIAFVDVTETANARQAIAASERKYRELFENLLDIWVQADTRGQLTAVSPSVTRVLGYSVDELVGHNIDHFECEADQWNDLMAQLAIQGNIQNHESRFRHKDGSERWFSVHARAEHDSGGATAAVEALLRDITALKHSQMERDQLETRLSQAQKLEAIGTLAGGIAHDFNNILSAILGYGELTLDELPADSAEHGHIRQVVDAALRASALVKQILAFSRHAEHERKPVQPHRVVAEAMHLLRASIPTTIEIHETIAGDSGQVVADPTQLHQIVMNLCTNAYQAMRDTGGVLVVDLRAIEVDRKQAAQMPDLRPGSYVRLQVSDTGHGMTEDVLSRAFDPFFTTKSTGDGTGMGLAVVHGIVKTHDGAIAIHSDPEEGTRVDVYLPVHQDDCGELPAGKPTLPCGNGQRLLVVDDEPALVDLLEHMLTGLGYRVVAENDAQAALATFLRTPSAFDAVLTDQTMPGLTGAALAQEIHRVRPNLPILICTGYSEVLDESRARAAGARALAMKPLDRGQLAALLHNVWQAGNAA